jgi:hypothetical protein
MDEILQWFTENVNAEKIALFGQFIVSGGALTWAVGIYNKFKTQSVTTPKEIASRVDGTVKDAVKTTITESLKSYENKLSTITQNEKILAECLVLLSQNDPQAKLALINNITKIANIDTNILEAAKQEVAEEIKTEAVKEEAKQEVVQALEEPVKFL